MTLVPSVLDLIAERQAVITAAIATLREQIGKLTDELVTAETDLDDLVTTHATLTRLMSMNQAAVPAADPPDNTVYQQIITAFTTGISSAMRAKDVCHQLGLDTEHKDTEGVRAKLKRLVKRSVLSEPETGLFTLAGTGLTDQTARDQQP